MIRIVDPPREVPVGLQLRILMHRHVHGSVYWFLLAAATLVAGTMHPGTGVQIGLLMLGSLLLAMGLKAALPALVRAAGTLKRMRLGFETMGRIVSCRLDWDDKRMEMSYRDFLENWTVNVVRSQSGKAAGCLSTVVVAVFVIPLVMMMLVAVVAYVAGFLKSSGSAVMAGAWSGSDLATFCGMGLGFIAMVLLILRAARRSVTGAVVPYMEWRRLAHPGTNDAYDDDAMRLVALAKERGEQISLKEPLPERYPGVELVCTVEYSAMGEACTATGRARLSNRLDPAGVERILFNNLERDKVDLFAGLPDEAGLDAQGCWRDAPAFACAVHLGVTGAAAVVAIAAFLRNVTLLQVTFN